MKRASSKFLIFLVAPVVTVCAASPAHAACSSKRVSVRLPAQQLQDRLVAITRNTGCAVGTAYPLPDATWVPAVSGKYSALDLYRKALKGTGLSLRRAENLFYLYPSGGASDYRP